MNVFAPLGLYLVLLCGTWLINKREFSRSPEKGQRYKALPLVYKMACWFGIIPLLVASTFVERFLFLGAVVGYMVLEGACVRWYRKNGFLSE